MWLKSSTVGLKAGPLTDSVVVATAMVAMERAMGYQDSCLIMWRFRRVNVMGR